MSRRIVSKLKSYLKLQLLPLTWYLKTRDCIPSSIEKVKLSSGVSLKLPVFYPDKLEVEQPLKSIIFFPGGAWRYKANRQFYKQACYFRDRGYVVFCPNYRTFHPQHLYPLKSNDDVIAVYQYIFENSGRFNLDLRSVVTAGASVGGHMAALPFLPMYKRSISIQPAAMILYNPVLDTTELDFLGSYAKDFSVTHHLDSNLPPTFIVHGTRDSIVPFKYSEIFHKRMANFGCSCALIPFEGKAHGFFNPGKGRSEDYKRVLKETDKFLNSLQTKSYIKGLVS